MTCIFCIDATVRMSSRQCKAWPWLLFYIFYLFPFLSTTNGRLGVKWSDPSSDYDLSHHHYDSNHSRLIVAARHVEDITWLDLYFSEIPHIIMQVGEPHETVGIHHKTSGNRGREGSAYVEYIFNNYERLPASIAFVHGHRGSWHLRDIVPVLQRLRWGSHGFANFRYSPMEEVDWECGNKGGKSCSWAGGTLFPGDLKEYERRKIHKNDMLFGIAREIVPLWTEILHHELGPLPRVVYAPCCAQFLVSRERIRRRSKAFYGQLAHWLRSSPRPGGPRRAMVMEYVWHIIFGEPAEVGPVEKCALLFCDEPVVLKEQQEEGSVQQEEGSVQQEEDSVQQEVGTVQQEERSVQQEGVTEPHERQE